MTMISNCLAKLVKAGRISEKTARDAEALHEGMQGRLYPAMGPTSAEASGALEAARAMADAARQRKLAAAQMAIRQRQLLDRMSAHPKGKTAGLFGAMVRDIYETPEIGEKINVESHSDALVQELQARGHALIEGYASRFAGLLKDTASIWNIIREGYGRNTGDDLAKSAWKGWDEAVKYGTDRITRAGKPLHVRDDWRFMQFWETSRVRDHSQSEFVDDLMREYGAGGLRVRDKATGDDAGKLAVPGIIANAYDDIFHGRGSGVGGFSNNMRVFNFTDPEAYIRMMKKYGIGEGGLYNAFLGHMGGMAREIAWTEVFGPNYERTFTKLLDAAREDDRLRMSPTDPGSRLSKAKAAARRMAPTRSVTSPAAAQRTFDYLTGRLSAVDGDMMAGIFGGLRNLSTAAKLGSAVVSAIPGDSVTAALAANDLGIAPSAVIGRLVKDLALDRETGKEIAAQLGLSASSVIDAALGAKRFEDEMVGQNLTGRLAEFVIRAQGLQAWTEGLKRAFSMEVMGMVARQADHAFDSTDPAFRKFLTRYGFTADDWDKLRATPQLEAQGARFFDTGAVDDRRLADRLRSAVIDERRFAVIEPDGRIKQLTTGGAQRGTLLGELARSGFMFKSFSMSIMTTHMMRNAMQGNWGSAAFRMGAYLLTTTIAGAAAVQALNVVTGKDPQDMTDPRFWLSSVIRGGGLGFYGDFLYSAQTRGQAGIYQALAGPVAGTGIAMAADLVQGKMTGRNMARYLKEFTPGSTLWYTRLATDRLIFDQIQSLIDPDYRKAFSRYEKRLKKDYGQQFWWSMGKTAPDRAPDFGNAAGQ